MKRFFIICLLILLFTTVYADKVSKQIEKKNHTNVKTYSWEETASKFIKDDGKDGRSVPGVIDYQGKITDSSNNPITSNVNLVFAIYDVSSGGTNLWTETHKSVTPVDGLVHVLLGSQTSFGASLFDGSDLWLGINVNSDDEMSPRLRIASVPYSIYANDSDNLDGHNSDYFMPASTVLGIDDLTDAHAGSFSVCVGSGTSSGGSNNAFLGVDSGKLNTSGLANTFIGRASGYTNIGGNYNTYLGYCAGYASTGSSNVFLGQWAGADETDSNKLYIDNARTETPLIYGDFTDDSEIVKINGDFQATGETQDSNGDAGTSGQVLSSTGSGTSWINTSEGDITGITAGSGLTGGGDSGGVVLNHEDTSTQSSVNNADGNVLQDISFDAFGHVTGIISSDLDNRYYTETEIDADYVNKSDLNHLNAADGSPTDAVYVDNDGKVGINDNTPSYQLDVDGIINLTSHICLSGVPSFINSGSSVSVGPGAGSNFLTSGTGQDNSFFGYLSGSSITTGTYNILVGHNSGMNLTSGIKNTVVGSNSGLGISTTSNNTFLGNEAGRQNNGSSNVFIGYQSGYYTSGVSNKLFIENSSSNLPLIFGDFTNGSEVVKIFGDFETTGTATIGDVLHLTPIASAPSSPSEGDIYVNSTNNHIYCYLGGSWKQLDN